MEYLSLVTRVDNLVEEEVDLEIENYQLTTFASICPYPIDVNKKYNIDISLTILDELRIIQLKEKIKAIKRKGNTFGYLIQGYLKDNGTIDAGIVFDCEELIDYPEYFNSYIEIEVDRITAEFL